MKRSKKSRKCPRCAGKEIMLQDSFDDGVDLYVCLDCDYEFEFSGSNSKHRNDYYDYEDEDDYKNSEEEWEN